MIFYETKLAKWLSIVQWCNTMPADIAHRMRCAFDWAGAVENLPDLTAEEIASAAASHFGPQHFWYVRQS